MKIVQSLWSKPGRKNNAADHSDVNKCGWPDKKYNYFSWALSALQFRKFYDQLELVTDAEGYDLLINKMELPYTSASVVLDKLDNYHPNLWALGKLYAYSIQEEPFIHADGDVYIWERFTDLLENADLLCQHKEDGAYFNRVYSTVFMEMLQHFDFYPSVLDKSISRNNNIVAVNAGLLGGSNIDFFKTYTSKAFEFVDRNAGKLDRINVGLSNIVFEQFLFYALAEEHGKEIFYYKTDVNNLLNDFADYTGIPAKTKYVHTPGSLKEERYLVNALEYRMQKDYPDHYYRIIHLLRTNQI